MWGKKEEPELKDVFNQRRPSAVEAMSQQHRKSVSNQGLTGASALTVRQSIFPITLVTILFFLWGKLSLTPFLHSLGGVVSLTGDKQVLHMDSSTFSMLSFRRHSISQQRKLVVCREPILEPISSGLWLIAAGLSANSGMAFLSLFLHAQLPLLFRVLISSHLFLCELN